MAVFVLIHGGFHGAWCWDRLIPELEARGHSAVAADLPIDDPSCSNTAYADHAGKSLEQVTDDIVLVGHSQGGLTAPLLADDPRITGLVLLHALIPVPQTAFAEEIGRSPDLILMSMDLDQDERDCLLMPAAQAVDVFYHDCEPSLASWASSRLRPQSTAPLMEPCPLERWPDRVPTTYVVAERDRALSPDACRRLAREHGQMTVVDIDSGHSSFLSRPTEIADLLCAKSVVEA
jgi:pimeloyl-ACP methyl ester carboxylesterase